VKVVIMGCGRVGAHLAALLDKEGHHVTLLDINPSSFDRLARSFKGNALLGDGTDEDSLKRAGIVEADAFVAVTQGDNRNVMAAQIAKRVFKVPKVVCRIYDPGREELYRTLGLDTFCPTTSAALELQRKLTAQPERES
jgi:trk system potassium uptake protein TrkA